MPLVDVISSKLSNKRKLSMISGNKYYKPKKNVRLLEVPLAHAHAATEAHLRALSIINDDEEVSLEFTSDLVKISVVNEKKAIRKNSRVEG